MSNETKAERPVPSPPSSAEAGGKAQGISPSDAERVLAEEDQRAAMRATEQINAILARERCALKAFAIYTDGRLVSHEIMVVRQRK